MPGEQTATSWNPSAGGFAALLCQEATGRRQRQLSVIFLISLLQRSLPGFQEPSAPLSFLPSLQGLGELEKEGSVQRTGRSFKVAESQQPETL